ncbi:hypothetical protein DNTS_029947 [Danionella cerebrum]|uniref:Ig-like domain-containing protein n=1 Tax=Danionella cerebrum TaxID=2873325 RepID=A0A553RQ01_9TELE|nr:hypothetical protein DNTS_029947 [Danionella translucida]
MAALSQSIRALHNYVADTEGSPLTLSCEYNGSVNSLHWYRQYPGSKPEFVLLVMESTNFAIYADPQIPGMEGKASRGDKRGAFADTIQPLYSERQISRGDSVTLSCNYSGLVYTLQWYRQYPRAKPEFLILTNENSEATEPSLRLAAKDSSKAKQVNLTIFDAVESDSAVYFCALRPTLIESTRTLNKNPFSSSLQMSKDSLK